MRTDYDFKTADLFGPVAFRPDFNDFQQITPAQAWSLFFTGSNEDKVFDRSPEAGRFFTQAIGASVLAVALWGAVFTGI
ncbi:MAG: hypothetical protein HC805_00135 [Alkalinema sp. RL_2_19]|nr:hypothetical protein [Alkalinema sp. RL_2_19]